MGYPKIVEDAYGVMYLNIYAYGIRSLSCNIHHLKNNLFSFSSIFNNSTLFKGFFFVLILLLITRTLKYDGLAAAFSTASLTELQ